MSIAAQPGTEVLATYTHPYFDRSPEHFSSHKQTPPGVRTDEPLITQNGRVIYIANPFFRSYSQDAFGIQKLVVRELIRRLLPEPLIQTENVPSTAQVTILKQADRHVIHVLHYPLTRRAPDIDIIEEPGTLADVQISVRVPKPSSVKLVPKGEAVPFKYATGYATFRVPTIVGHQAIEIA
jgi:hypothetical protein